MPLTAAAPKCMIPLNGEPILHRAVRLLNAQGVDDIVVVRGYQAAFVECAGCTYVLSPNWAEVNILGSLLSASDALDGDIIVLYGDIVYTSEVLRAALRSAQDIAPVVDLDWITSYQGRIAHPVEEAEKVLLVDGAVRRIGKGRVALEDANGEFVGMLRLNEAGCRKLLDAADLSLAMTEPGLPRPRLSKASAYLADLLQFMIDKGEQITPTLVMGGWREIDTIEDVARAEDWLASPR